MLNIGPTTRVFLAAGATDMRKNFDGLFALVKERLQLDPLNGHLYVFCNRWRNRIKVLYWDGHGLWVCAKRLERGRFAWPVPKDHGRVITLDAAQWILLIEGIDLNQTQKRRWHRLPVEEKNACSIK